LFVDMNIVAEEDKKQVISLLDEAYACRTSNLNQSSQLAKKALVLSRKINDNALIGKSLTELALFSMIKGEHEQSMAMSEKAIKYFEELNDEKGIANAKYNIAGIYYKTDNFHLGLVYLVDCLTTYRKFNDYHNQARAEKSLGTIYEYFGDQKKAVQSYEDAINSARKAGDINLESNAYNPLSGIYLKQGKIEKAFEIIERSIAMKKQTGDIRGLAFSIYGRAKIYAKIRQFDKAERDYKEAISIHQEMGERLGLGMAYHKLSRMYVELGELQKAKTLLNNAIKFSRLYNTVIITFKCNYLLYVIYKQENKPVKALGHLELYLKQKEAVINTQTLKVIENYELISKMELLEKEAQAQREKAEIIEKKNRAEQAATVKQEFLSTMSHEIRTPLNAVITIASLLESKADDEEKELVDSLKFASNNLLLIINDILDFTKLESGKARIEARPCNFYKLLGNIKSTYASLATEKGLKLELQLGSNISEFYEADETKISQILGNLITNAIKFTENGSVIIQVEKTAGSKCNDTLSFKIIDTGSGIAEKDLEDVFESFSQPASITTRKQGGSGLGLAIVKKLVMLHSSNVKVSSIIGKGSVFYFDIELKRSLGQHSTPAKYSDLLKDKHVLLAEDNMINAMLISKLLANWKITTVHARNGIEAVEKSKTQSFDFILMDIHMPEMDGFEATKCIRDNVGLQSKTPIFAITADITAEYMEEYCGFFSGFLRKPIEIDKLHEALVSAL
jgi:signal transduction histidine kinase/Tfp pilus assembly protein PilF